jgi:hypothetical protein
MSLGNKNSTLKEIIAICEELMSDKYIQGRLNLSNGDVKVMQTFEHMDKRYFLLTKKFANDGKFTRNEQRTILKALEVIKEQFRKLNTAPRSDMSRIITKIHNQVDNIDKFLLKYMQTQNIKKGLLQDINTSMERFKVLNGYNETKDYRDLLKKLGKETPIRGTNISAKEGWQVIDWNNIIMRVDAFLNSSECDFPQDVRDYLLSLTGYWVSNIVSFIKNKNIIETDFNAVLLQYCSSVIMKRIFIAFILQKEGKIENFMRFMIISKPSVQEIKIMLRDAMKKKNSSKPKKNIYAQIIGKLRLRIAQTKQKGEKGQVSQQQMERYANAVDLFQKQLMQQQQQKKKKQGQQQNYQQQKQVSSRLQTVSQQTKQLVSQRVAIQRVQQQLLDFPYISPRYGHKDNKRLSQQKNTRLRDRKNDNIRQLQQSITDQSLPKNVMLTAVRGGFTSIILVDEANQRHKDLREIPYEVPQKYRKKPLFVLIEQGDLDPADKIPKVVMDDSNVSSGILRLKVSCAKLRTDGRMTDCFMKQSQNDFTANPMDDFVLLTLKQTLRSFYHQYMRNKGIDVSKLVRIEQFQQLLTYNPYGVLVEDQQIGNLLQKTYRSAKLVSEVPYTWISTNDLHKDWTRFVN